MLIVTNILLFCYFYLSIRKYNSLDNQMQDKNVKVFQIDLHCSIKQLVLAV